MRAVIQRVSAASVRVDGAVVGEIDAGLLVLLGVADADGEAELEWLAEKVSGLRIFADAEGKMNRSILDLGLGALVVSQFTLFGDVRKGKRPSFVRAGKPEHAAPMVQRFCDRLVAKGVSPVAQGMFAADMKVSLVNDGPVTLVIDTQEVRT